MWRKQALSGMQSHLGDIPLKSQVVYSPNGTAVLKWRIFCFAEPLLWWWYPLHCLVFSNIVHGTYLFKMRMALVVLICSLRLPWLTANYFKKSRHLSHTRVLCCHEISHRDKVPPSSGTAFDSFELPEVSQAEDSEQSRRSFHLPATHTRDHRARTNANTNETLFNDRKDSVSTNKRFHTLIVNRQSGAFSQLFMSYPRKRLQFYNDWFIWCFTMTNTTHEIACWFVYYSMYYYE